MDLSSLLSAVKAHQWVLVAAMCVGSLVAASKQGWLGSYLAKLPKAWLPWVAVVLSALGLASSELMSGVSVSKALIDALGAALLAVFAHETVVEGMRGGKELLPKAPWTGNSSSQTPPAAP